MQNKYIIVYVTAPNSSEAKKIAACVLENKLAACANIIEGINSSYWWQGKIENTSEVLIIMKTTGELFEKLAAVVKKLHSYEVPEIIAAPIIAGSPDYLKWIKESVTDEYLSGLK